MPTIARSSVSDVGSESKWLAATTGGRTSRTRSWKPALDGKGGKGAEGASLNGEVVGYAGKVMF